VGYYFLNNLRMCDVPSIAVFCSKFIECFPSIASRFLLKLFVTNPVAPIIISTIVHFKFHVRFTSEPEILYFITSFQLPFALHLCLSVHGFSFWFLIIMSGVKL
jgi:hypothetical protein